MGDFDFKTTEFTVEGFRDLYKVIDHVPDVAKRAELEPMLARSLGPMRVYAATLAPDDPLTGPPWNLPTSIEVGTRQRSGRSKSDRALGRFDARAYMGPTKFGYPQALFQEFGTVKMAANPYMRPAWDSQKEVTLELIKAGFAERVFRIAAKYGPGARVPAKFLRG